MNFPSLIKNFFQAFSSYSRKTPFCNYKPLIVMIEPTNHCNIACSNCAQNLMTREKGFMKFSLYENFINKNKQSINFLDLYLIGEPYLHPQLPEMISLARSNKIWTRVFTNGTMPEKIIKNHKNFELPDVLVISLRAKEGKMAGQSLIKTEKTISDLLKHNAFRKKSSRLCISIIKNEWSQEARKSIISKFKKMGVHQFHEMSLHGWPGTVQKPIIEKYSPKFLCYLPWFALTILWDGSVVGCCDDYNGMNSIGTITDGTTLKSIWNSSQMQNLRINLAKRDLGERSLCKSCERLYLNPFKNSMIPNIRWIWQDFIIK